MLDDAAPDLVLCTVCGRPLGESYDDHPDWPTGPLCGACYQANEEADEIWWLEEAGEK